MHDLVTHYSKHELTAERKAFATIDSHASYIKLYIAPKWGEYRLSAVRTIAVEEWLHSLPLAPGTRTKLRNIMSAIFTHGIRYEWITFNPISKVRCSAVRLREPDVLSPDEFRLLLTQLPLREEAMVRLVASTGLRRSEMFALRWSNIDMEGMQVTVTGNVVRNRLGKVKTKASGKPVPLHGSVCTVLNAVSADKRLASGRQIEMLMGDPNVSEKSPAPLRTVDFSGVTVGQP